MPYDTTGLVIYPWPIIKQGLAQKIFTLPAYAVAGNVTVVAYNQDSQRLTPDLQPSISRSGNIVVMTFPRPNSLPISGTVIMSVTGTAMFAFEFSSQAGTPNPGGGTTPLPDLRLPVVSNGQTIWNIGGGETRSRLYYNGAKMTRNIDYLIELPYLTWVSSVPIDTQDILELTN